jgi:hypothetical protein
MHANTQAAANPPEEDCRSSADTLPLGSRPPRLPPLLPSCPNPPAAAASASEPDDALLLLVLLLSPTPAAAACIAAAAAVALAAPTLPEKLLSPLMPAVLALLLTPSMGVSLSAGPAALLLAAGASNDNDLELGFEPELCCVLLDELVMRPSTTGSARLKQLAQCSNLTSQACGFKTGVSRATFWAGSGCNKHIATSITAQQSLHGVHAYHGELHLLQAFPAAQAHTGHIHCRRAAVPTQQPRQQLLQLLCGWVSWCLCHLWMRQSGKTRPCLGCQPGRSTQLVSCHPVAAAPARRACLSCCCRRCWPSHCPVAWPATGQDNVRCMVIAAAGCAVLTKPLHRAH